jgi:nucleotide-binding universal stress UspA family protein
MPKLIIAYDGTPHAEDALALGRKLAELIDGSLTLAHVHRADPRNRPPSGAVRGREAFLRRESERLLEQARTSLGDRQPVGSHAVAATTTARGLRELADQEGADLIVFGSAYNGPAGRVHPGSAARRLLHSARCAIAVAPDGLRERDPAAPRSIAYALDDSGESARTSAEALAGRDCTAVAAEQDAGADLLVIGSAAAAEGRVMAGAAAEQAIQASTAPVIVLANGHPLEARAPRAMQAA